MMFRCFNQKEFNANKYSSSLLSCTACIWIWNWIVMVKRIKTYKLEINTCTWQVYLNGIKYFYIKDNMIAWTNYTFPVIELYVLRYKMKDTTTALSCIQFSVVPLSITFYYAKMKYIFLIITYVFIIAVILRRVSSSSFHHYRKGYFTSGKLYLTRPSLHIQIIRFNNWVIVT